MSFKMYPHSLRRKTHQKLPFCSLCITVTKSDVQNITIISKVCNRLTSITTENKVVAIGAVCTDDAGRPNQVGDEGIMSKVGKRATENAKHKETQRRE